MIRSQQSLSSSLLDTNRCNYAWRTPVIQLFKRSLRQTHFRQRVPEVWRIHVVAWRVGLAPFRGRTLIIIIRDLRAGMLSQSFSLEGRSS